MKSEEMMPQASSSASVAAVHPALWARWRQGQPATAIAQADRAAAEAWTIFWQEQGAGSRCGTNAPMAMREALDSHWRAFASTLAPETRVLDIGCGAGAVGRDLLTCQPCLRITGIDFADIGPSGDPRIELLPNMPMESLSFADRTFGAAVSQFGYEYGRVREAAGEVARVLAPGAPLSFLVHHSESPISAGCDSHLRALDQLTGAPLREAFASGNPAALEHRLSAIRRDCPAERIVEHAARGLGARIHANGPERARVWEAVVAALAPELIMARSLKASYVAPDELTRWLEPLTEWFELRPPSVLRMAGTQPLAWKIEGRRR